jgi:hypothetical protein
MPSLENFPHRSALSDPALIRVFDYFNSALGVRSRFSQLFWPDTVPSSSFMGTFVPFRVPCGICGCASLEPRACAIIFPGSEVEPNANKTRGKMEKTPDGSWGYGHTSGGF